MAEEERETQLDEERRSAFYNTLYATDEGRNVLLWIQKWCYGRFGDLNEISPERALASLALIELYQEIRANCGLDEADVIDAEAGTLKIGE